MSIKKHYIVVLIVGIFISSGVMLYDHFSKENPQLSLEKAFNHLEKLYQKDSLQLVDGFLVDGEINHQLEHSPFSISILDKNDSLVYWNIARASQKEDFAAHYKKQFSFQSFKVTFALDLFDGGRLNLNPILDRQYLPQYEYLYNPEGKILLPFEDNPVNLSIANRYINSNWHNYLLILWYLSLGLMGLFVLHLYKRSVYFGEGVLGWLLYSGFAIAFGIVGGFFATKYLFGAHYLAKIMTTSNGAVSLLTFTSLLIFLALWIEGLNKTIIIEKWLNLPDLLRYLLGSLLVNGLMFFMILQSEKFIMNGGVTINIEEVLNLSLSSVYYILLLMGYCILYYYFSALLYRYRQDGSSKVWQRMVGHTIGLTLAAVLFMWLGIDTPIIPIVLFLIAYFLIHDLYEEYNAKNLTYVLINVILFAAFLSVVIFYSALRKDKLDRKEDMKENFTFLSESEKQTVKTIRDSLIQSNLSPSIASLSFPSPMESLTYTSPMDRTELMGYIREIIKRGDSTHTFNLVGLECYDQFGNSLFFNHISNFQANNALIRNSKKIADKIYYLPLRSLTSIYFQIENDDFLNSPINMIIKLAKPSKTELPNLENKNYLVYKNNNLIYSFSNDFLDINKIDPASLEEDIDIGEMSYVVYAPGNEYKIIDFHEVAGLIKPISFFSLIFIIAGLFIVLLTLLNSRWSFLPKELDFKFYNQSSLRSKIQLSVILLIIFSFFVIGIITTVYFKNIVSSNDRSKFKSELKTIINDVNNRLTESIDAGSASDIIAQEFSALENIYNRRFAYYNQSGELVVRSDEYSNVFNRVPYSALQGIVNGGGRSLKSVSQQITDDQVLIPIYQSNTNPIGYLTMNYSSTRSISSGIYNHLGNLLNVYIFLFFLAGAISIFIANSITEPLAKLREGVKKFKLGKTNEPLDYESSDELGVLIKEYNAMTKKLDKSAQIIAKTERDMAWREMAKQVAHEIKNPLTPMKLHIQHLENAVSSSPERAKDMIKKVASTLIEQINNLSNIASEFSNYATLPKAENHKTGLNEVVEHVHDLFRERDDMDIFMNEPIDDLIVFADRNHLVRILVNIIKNAIQSIPQDRRGKVEIELSKVEDRALIVITDNGVGIPDHMKDKIFTPNFTTKSSGTGLGLAICVNMLDTMNGKIYFESEENIGTKFFIEIPIMRLGQSSGDVLFLD